VITQAGSDSVTLGFKDAFERFETFFGILGAVKAVLFVILIALRAINVLRPCIESLFTTNRSTFEVPVDLKLIISKLNISRVSSSMRL